MKLVKKNIKTECIVCEILTKYEITFQVTEKEYKKLKEGKKYKIRKLKQFENKK